MAALPLGPGLKSIKIESVEQVLSSTALSGRQQVRSRNAQHWRLRLEWPRLHQEEWRPIRAALIRARTEVIDVVPPIEGHSGSRAILFTASNASPGVSTIRVVSGTLAPLLNGRYVRFAGHNKVYLVTRADTPSGRISLFPKLREQVTANKFVQHSSVAFRCRLASDNDLEWTSAGPGALVRLAVELDEVID